MAQLNSVCLIGRLVRDPEIRKTQSNKSVWSFVLAVDGFDGKEKTSYFIPCNCWVESACNYASKYLGKGSLLAITGKLITRKITGKDGKTKTVMEVNTTTVECLEKSKSQSNNNANDEEFASNDSANSGMVDNDDLPF